MPASSRENRWATPSTSTRWVDCRRSPRRTRERSAGDGQPAAGPAERARRSTTTDRPPSADHEAAAGRHDGRRRGRPWRRGAARRRWPRPRVDAAGGRGWPNRGTDRDRSACSSSAASRAAATRATSAWRVGMVVAGGRQPVEPAGVDLAAADLRTLEQVEQERLVRRPAADDHDHLGQRSSEPGDRLVTVAPAGDDLGDHRVVLGRDHVALGDAGVDADARPDREARASRSSRAPGRSHVADPRR